MPKLSQKINSLISTEAKRIRDQIDTGVTCRCCNTHLRRYTRPFNCGMARGLIRIYNVTIHEKPEHGWIHLSKYFEERKTNAIHLDYKKVQRWGLLESLGDVKHEGHRSGFYRITQKGKDFVLGKISIQSHIILTVPKERFEGFTGDLIDIRDALSKKFDYNELMNTRP